MTVIAVFNQKGGVGKTTTTLSLAAALARNGYAPVALDMDPQAHLTALCGHRPTDSAQSLYGFFKKDQLLSELVVPLSSGVNLIPGHMELAKVDTLRATKTKLMKLTEALDREQFRASGEPILIDCCPMLGYLSIAAILAADVVVVPVTPEYLTVNGTGQLVHTLKGMEKLSGVKPRRYFINRFVAGHPTHERVSNSLRNIFGSELCKTVVKDEVNVIESGGSNQDVFSFTAESVGGEDFAFLLDELVESGFIKLPEKP